MPFPSSGTERAIADARSFGLLGNSLFDKAFGFDIEVMKGAGAYVCGEETALIESLEGHRGHPRNKPPYPVVSGLWGKPTVVNNVETLANIADIVRNGANWFKQYGTPKCAGTKVYTILGHVATPGLIETEMGTTLRDIIYEYGGGITDGKAVQGCPRGRSGRRLPRTRHARRADGLRQPEGIRGSIGERCHPCHEPGDLHGRTC